MGVTEDLSIFAVETKTSMIPEAILHEAKRDAINVIGVAIYAAADPSARYLLDLFEEEGSKPRAAAWGTGVRTNLQNAALFNGYLSHLEDYDDTHFPTVLHPSAPTVPAAFAIAESAGVSGRDFLAAVALGIETSCRLSMAVHPWHYDEGWHITGTFGVFGSIVAAGRLMGLDRQQMVTAFGIGGTQAAGVREVFGSMTKPLHAGRAAQTGVMAGQLAQRGFTSTNQILEGRRGLIAVASSDSDLSRATDGLGERWEMTNNGLKPYACGVVAHAIIDACVAARGEGQLDVAEIVSIEAEVHPLVLELINRPEPRTRLEGKFSVQHAITAGLIDGAAHPAQFSDAKVNDPRFVGLRSKVRLIKNEAFEEEEAQLKLTLRNGEVVERYVEHCTGSPHNPMSDAVLSEKFLSLASANLGSERAGALLRQLWQLEEMDDLNLLRL